MSEDFDVLSYFSGGPPVNKDSFVLSENPVPTKFLDPVEEIDDDEAPVHFLDLPSVSLKPPGKVLHVLLKLLKADMFNNFGSEIKEKSLDEMIDERGLHRDDIDEVIPWFSQNSDVLSNIKRLAYISHNVSNLNPYFTSIVSSELSWIDDVQLREQIWKESSLRLSENCGRTAQPEFVRNIVIPGFEAVKLNEPSLTSDNLGLKTWGSSLILSQRLIDNHIRLVEEPVLELGAGTGLAGITCAKLGYQDVMLTDLPEIVNNLRKNVELNNLQDTKIEVLDWSDSSEFDKLNNDKKYNTIILSDPIYSSQHPIWVVNMLLKYLSSSGKVLLQIPIRANFAKERELLWELLQEQHFKEIETHFEDGYDDFGEQNFIFKVYIHSSSSSNI